MHTGRRLQKFPPCSPLCWAVHCVCTDTQPSLTGFVLVRNEAFGSVVHTGPFPALALHCKPPLSVEGAKCSENHPVNV